MHRACSHFLLIKISLFIPIIVSKEQAMEFFNNLMMTLISWELSGMGTRPDLKSLVMVCFTDWITCSLSCPRAYKPYCRYRVVNIFSDNISLVYLRGMAFDGRLASYFQGYRLTWHHISGKKQNWLADCNSRSYEEMSTTEREVFIPNIDPKDEFFICHHSK